MKSLIAFNDIDLSLKILQSGYKLIYNPYSVLFHLKSKSRGHDIATDKTPRFREDMRRLYAKWGDKILLNDPFYSKNLSLLTHNFELKKNNEDNILKDLVDYNKNPHKHIVNF